MRRLREREKMMSGKGLFRGVLLLGLVVGMTRLAPAAAPTETEEPGKFSSPEAAVTALREAVSARDMAALRQIFGPALAELRSGDEVQDKADMEDFAQRLADRAELTRESDGSVILEVGDQGWPFPIPLVRRGAEWQFDTKAGITEIQMRRVGANEMDALRVLRAIYLAQREYRAENGGQAYASRLLSTPGERDGLYWKTAEGELPSPLGPLAAEAAAEGYQRPSPGSGLKPYHGYYYRILTGQGPNAPGGEKSYLEGEKLTGGFALLAYPAKWGTSGVMTFLMGPTGRVLEKDLGADTEALASASKQYDPDSSWTEASPAPPAYVLGVARAAGPVALPEGAVVSVYLADMSDPNVPKVIAEETIREAAQIPLRFQVEYDPAKIGEKGDYVVAVSVRAGGELLWKQATPVSVLTKGKPSFAEVQLAQVPKSREGAS